MEENQTACAECKKREAAIKRVKDVEDDRFLLLYMGAGPVTAWTMISLIERLVQRSTAETIVFAVLLTITLVAVRRSLFSFILTFAVYSITVGSIGAITSTGIVCPTDKLTYLIAVFTGFLISIPIYILAGEPFLRKKAPLKVAAPLITIEFLVPLNLYLQSELMAVATGGLALVGLVALSQTAWSESKKSKAEEATAPTT